jgi:hypothetical protein
VIAINGKQQADDCNWIGSDFPPSSSLLAAAHHPQSLARPLPPESKACSNETCGISIRVNTAKRIVGKWIRPSRLRQPRGPLEASSTGGSKSASSGWDGCAVQTAVNDGSKLLIFGQPKRPDDHGLSLSLVVRRIFTECHNRLSAWTIYAELSRMDRPVFRSFLWRPAQRSP